MIERLIQWVLRRDTNPTPIIILGEIICQRYMPLWRDEAIRSGIHYNRPPWYRPFNILFHRWTASMPEAFHDHPRWTITICLRGSLIEHTPWKRSVLKSGSIRIRTHRAIHALEVPDLGTQTWTMFIVGRRNYKQNTYKISRH